MKAKYIYPELFLNKIGDLYWSTGHPSFETLPEDQWKPLFKIAERQCAADQLSENRPQLTLKSEFGNIDYVRTGQMGKETLILVPGFPDTWFTFHKIIPILAKYYDVISYSPPGHGYSSFTSLFNFSIDHYCLVLRMIIHRFQLKKVHLVGHSIGGEQVLRTTLQTKGLNVVESLTLLNAWGPSVFPRRTQWDFSEDVTTWPLVGKELVRLFGGRLGGLKEMYKKAFYRSSQQPDIQKAQREISKPLLGGTTFEWFINNQSAQAIAAMQKEQKRINESVAEYFWDTRRQFGYLPEIPMMVIGTKHDRIFPYAYARSLFSAIQKQNRKTFFRKIKTAGHMPAMETPERLAYLMLTFLERNFSPEFNA